VTEIYFLFVSGKQVIASALQKLRFLIGFTPSGVDLPPPWDDPLM
jgi:hypothetical protein